MLYTRQKYEFVWQILAINVQQLTGIMSSNRLCVQKQAADESIAVCSHSIRIRRGAFIWYADHYDSQYKW